MPAQISSDHFGRASSGAAKALLGHVYLTMAGKLLQQDDMYSLAADKLSEIVAEYALQANFSDVFSLLMNRIMKSFLQGQTFRISTEPVQF